MHPEFKRKRRNNDLFWFSFINWRVYLSTSQEKDHQEGATGVNLVFVSAFKLSLTTRKHSVCMKTSLSLPIFKKCKITCFNSAGQLHWHKSKWKILEGLIRSHPHPSQSAHLMARWTWAAASWTWHAKLLHREPVGKSQHSHSCIVTDRVSTVQHNLQRDQWLYDNMSLHRWPLSYVFSPRLHSNTQMTAAPVISHRPVSAHDSVDQLLCSELILVMISARGPVVCNTVACSYRGLNMQIWDFYMSGFTSWKHVTIDFKEEPLTEIINNE